MKSPFSKGLIIALGLSAALVASAMEPAELAGLRSKAVRGNVLAQYNLGRYYSDVASGVLDRAEAFAWLKLAAENGTGSLELVKLTEEMSPAELTEGRRRLEERREQMRTTLKDQSAAAGSAVVADAGASPAASEQVQKLTAERDQLNTSLNAAISELAQLRAAQAKAGGAPEKLRSELTRAEGELNEARASARQLAAKNQQLEDTASERGRALEAIKLELEQAKAAAQKPAAVAVAAPAANDAVVALTAERDGLQKQLTAAQEAIRKGQADAERAERAEHEAQLLRSQNDKLSAEQSRSQEAAATAGQLTREVERLRGELAQAQVKAQQAQAAAAVPAVPASQELSQAREKIASLEKLNMELSARANAAEAKVAASTGSSDVDTLRSQLAESDMKLQAALRSFTVQQQEHEQERERATRSQADLEARLTAVQSENTSLNTRLQDALAEAHSKDVQLADSLKESGQARQSSLAAGQEATALRDQMRQTQAQLALVVEENNQLKTKIAVIAPPPASSLGTPIRPGTAAAQAAITLPPAITAPVVSKPVVKPAAEQPAVQAPRQHIIREGDSLSKISRRYYGTSERWNEIYEANRNILNDPAKLPLGGALRIP